MIALSIWVFVFVSVVVVVVVGGGFWLLVAVDCCWLSLVVGWLMVVVGCWLLAGGWWLVVVGCWLLAVGCWLLLLLLMSSLPLLLFLLLLLLLLLVVVVVVAAAVVEVVEVVQSHGTFKVAWKLRCTKHEQQHLEPLRLLFNFPSFVLESFNFYLSPAPVLLGAGRYRGQPAYHLASSEKQKLLSQNINVAPARKPLQKATSNPYFSRCYISFICSHRFGRPGIPAVETTHRITDGKSLPDPNSSLALGAQRLLRWVRPYLRWLLWPEEFQNSKYSMAHGPWKICINIIHVAM